jgi:hypothetical protein
LIIISNKKAGFLRLGWKQSIISDRQTNSFIENSIEAGILLGGNAKQTDRQTNSFIETQ